jgi:hypothetical protein
MSEYSDSEYSDSDNESFVPRSERDLIKDTGKQHFIANKIRKRNGKKPKYHTIKSKTSNHVTFRRIIRNELKRIDPETFIFPIRSRERSDTWWDCKPYTPKVW